MAKAPRATVAFYRRLYEYNQQVLETYLRWFSRRPWTEAVRPRGIAHETYRDTMIHIVRVHDAWLNYIVPDRVDELRKNRPDLSSYRSWKDVRTFYRQAWSGIDALLADITPADLLRPVKAPWMPGHYTLEDAFVQASFEQAHHIGEIIGALWRQNVTPPQMMWIPLLTGERVSVR